MNYKLIATDMDGTLLDEEHGITKENVEAIIKVQKEKGVKFVLASGRPSYAMLEYAKELQMDKYEGYVLAFNGGELIDMKTNEVIFHEGLEKKDIENVYKVSKEINVPMILYVGDTIYGTEVTDEVLYEVSQCNMKFQKFDKLSELEEKRIEKIHKEELSRQNTIKNKEMFIHILIAFLLVLSYTVLFIYNKKLF